MLVLTRKLGETIVVDGQAVITLMELRSGSVRIGIEAPRETSIVRGELLAEKEEAAV